MGDRRMTTVMNRVFLLSLIVIGSVITSADDDEYGYDENEPIFYPPDADMPHSAEEQAEHDMEKFDMNKDGKITLSELVAEFRQVYYDNKQDKRTTKAVTKDAKEYLTEMDEDKDGLITMQELTAYHVKEREEPHVTDEDEYD